jgi:hypothetical protein
VNLADCLTNLAGLFLSEGKAAGAEKLLQRALAIREKAEGRASTGYAEAKRQLILLYRAEKRNSEAKRLEQDTFR